MPQSASAAAAAAQGGASVARVRAAELVVVLATHDGAGWIGRTLEGYARQRDADFPWAIVVVDNASSDETRAVLAAYEAVLPLLVLSEPRPGKNVALNRAIETIGEGRGDFIFSDDDAVPCPGFLAAWRRVLSQRAGYGLFGGTVVPDFAGVEKRVPRRYAPWHAEIYARNTREEGPIAPRMIFGPNMAVRGDIIRAGFRFDETIGPSSADSDYPMGSETEFCVRVAREAEVAAWFARDPEVGHIVRPHQAGEAFILARAHRHGKGVAQMERGARPGKPPGLRTRLRRAFFTLAAHSGRPAARWNAAWMDGYLAGRTASKSEARPGKESAPGSGQRALRILLYTNVDRAEVGGVQAVVRSLRSHLAAQGHAVSSGWAVSSDGASDGGEDGWIAQFPVLEGQRRWLHGRTAWRFVRRLWRERPDVVNIHFASASARYFILFSRLLGYRVLITCHGSDLLRPLPQDAPHLPAVLRDADAVSTVSEAIRDRIAADPALAAARPQVIPNGVDTQFWRPAQDCAASTGAPPLIVAVGRLAPIKGFDVLIDALAQLAEAGTGCRLVLIGDGPEQAALERQARDRGAAGQIAFCGRLGPETVREHLRNAALFAMPSRSEGMPLALLEAMATGVPAVASRVGGVPRLAEGCARLVAPENPAALADGIGSLLADDAARDALARAGRERALAFSAARAHHRYESLMIALTRRPPGEMRDVRDESSAFSPAAGGT
ncbi:MAG: glycosyltransferase [Porphyrobacter sp.]|nr:glycosyltransferase [Porphyrobacter sp.]